MVCNVVVVTLFVVAVALGDGFLLVVVEEEDEEELVAVAGEFCLEEVPDVPRTLPLM